MIRQRGKFRTPGTFRTQVITNGTCPCLYLFYKKTQVYLPAVAPRHRPATRIHQDDRRNCQCSPCRKGLEDHNSRAYIYDLI